MLFIAGCNLFVVLSAILLQADYVLGHARITSPTPRAIENSVAKIDSTTNKTACHLYFCKGAQYADNVSNTRVYAPGTNVTFHIDIVAHHTGTAVDLATQKTIGSPVFLWPVYANNSVGPANWPKNESDFSIIIPSTLGTKCQTKGSCAIQWWWWAYSNGQTYENCVDFTTV
ncbi:hypothetical protein M408DRAFT_328976 [Serendipita vermifera MAFF 305830]|uniref:Uncharacterized protein n=1 Tax=Serendipita vermifera MAFF 305830 TaxID=933852 RepID=A0A0C3BB49_SERVB|nr:hypothetical protein M408DRAFT_328976 [Serendipita vermifera MAFF 305830]